MRLIFSEEIPYKGTGGGGIPPESLAAHVFGDHRSLPHLCQKSAYSSVACSGSGCRSHKVLHEWLASLQENNRTNNRNNAPSPLNNSSYYTGGPVELQAYELLLLHNDK